MENKETELPNEERTQCEIWSRVMGYYRPTTSYNAGKKSEYKDRKYFKEDCDYEDSDESKR